MRILLRGWRRTAPRLSVGTCYVAIGFLQGGAAPTANTARKVFEGVQSPLVEELGTIDVHVNNLVFLPDVTG
jgi:hypothetical protein